MDKIFKSMPQSEGSIFTEIEDDIMSDGEVQFESLEGLEDEEDSLFKK